MKKDDNSGVSIKQIIITALFLTVTTFGGLNIYRIVYDENVNTIQIIESANLENSQYEKALVENTEEDFIYRENLQYLAANVITEPSKNVVSRGNLVRNTADSIEIANEGEKTENKLLNAVLNEIKEISEKQEAIIGNEKLLEDKKVTSGDSELGEAQQITNSTKDEQKTDNNLIEQPVNEDNLINHVENMDSQKITNTENNTIENTSAPTEYIKTIDVKATAYCLCKKCCGKSPSNPNYGVTASGLKIIPGTGMKVVASDPSVIPLGTQVYIEGLYGAKDYGYAIVADTGSAIKNLKIDLYMDTHQMALNWGVKSVRVYILDK